MNNRPVAVSIVAALLGTFAVGVTTVTSAAQRTFVSTSGVDNPACSLASQCRTFAAALAATSSGGEMIVLDSGGYGKVTISQAVSIIAPPGVYAGISVFPGDAGITVAAGAKVVLRGLTINGQGGNRGIVVTSAGEVHIENCTVSNLSQHGIEIDGGAHTHLRGTVVRSNFVHGLYVASGSTSSVYAVDSQFSRNGQHGIHLEQGTLDAHRIVVDDNTHDGIWVQPTLGVSVRLTLTDSVVRENGYGGGNGVSVFPEAGNSVDAFIARSTIARNFSAGIGGPNPPLGGSAYVVVADSAVVQNGFGIISSTPAIVINVTGSTVANNGGPDLSSNGGVILSTGTNTLTGRGGADIAGTLTPNPLK